MSKIQANDITVQISTDGTTYKNLVCEIGNKLSKNRAVQQVATKCDSGTIAVGLGAKSYSIDFTAVVETAPTTLTQVSYKDLTGWFESGTYLYVKIENPSDGSAIYEQGRAYLTKLELDNQVQGVSQFSGTFTVDGALDTTP